MLRSIGKQSGESVESCCFLKIHLNNLVIAEDFPHSQILGAHTLTEMVSKCRNKLCFKKFKMTIAVVLEIMTRRYL